MTTMTQIPTLMTVSTGKRMAKKPRKILATQLLIFPQMVDTLPIILRRILMLIQISAMVEFLSGVTSGIADLRPVCKIFLRIQLIGALI